MRGISWLALGLSLAGAYGSVCCAQDTTLPKVIVIEREYMKPGKTGAVHEKAESAFVEAMMKAKSPTHYFALTSMSGTQRALFLISYPSFDAWQKSEESMRTNASFGAAMDHAGMMDGELQTSRDDGVLVMNEELSLNPRADLSGMRYMEISTYHVKPGRQHEFLEAVQMVKAAYEKIPGSHWGFFRLAFGNDSGDTFIVLQAHKSLAEVDEAMGNDKKFMGAIGDDGMKKLEELVAQSEESSAHQLFAFNGAMSYVSDEWIKSDPSFWKPRMGTSMTKAAPAADKDKMVAEKKGAN
jgi:hypothetical protein